MHTGRVSVIIPVYNGVRFIAEAVSSALSQTHQDIEVVVVNDGSPDTSKDIIQPLLRDPRVKYHEQANSGVANARNTGIRLSTGEYIAFLDQDDLWDPSKLARQVAYMEKNPAVALVHSDIVFIDAQGHPISTPDWAWVQDASGNCLDDLVMGNRIATLTAMVRRGYLDGVGWFRQEVAPADDWDLWLRLAARHPFGFIPEPLGLYRLHGDNESSNYLKMQIAETSVIERFIDEQGRPAAIPGAPLRRKLLALYKQTAQLATRENRQGVACTYWLKALAMQPWGMDIYAGLAWNALSPDKRRVLNWYHRKLFSKDEPNA
jgi:glycosyltransferase involved in cell wall biosynthesis